MIAESYSFKNYTVIADNTDLNTILDYGNYVCSLASSSTISNIPITNGFVLRVERNAYSEAWIKQTFTRFDTGDTYYRIIANNTFGEWIKIDTSQDLGVVCVDFAELDNLDRTKNYHGLAGTSDGYQSFLIQQGGTFFAIQIVFFNGLNKINWRINYGGAWSQYGWHNLS